MTAPDEVARWTPEERQELFQQVAAERNLTAIVVEKDYWVCWTLGALFSGPLRDAMVFKGGTSLSKVYGAIQRFSEDIDICVNRAAFGLPGEPTSEMLASRKRRGAHFLGEGDSDPRRIPSTGGVENTHSTRAPLLRLGDAGAMRCRRASAAAARSAQERRRQHRDVLRANVGIIRHGRARVAAYRSTRGAPGGTAP